jgi:sulfate/thiosulfate-binding protein
VNKLPIILAVVLASLAAVPAREITLLNVSYDPTRELYLRFNAAFADYWKAKTGDTVVVKQSNGGSGRQARSVIDGLQADVVTLGLSSDNDSIAEHSGRLPLDWQKRLPDHSSPYTSTVVLLVRKGNPKRIKDWGDLVRPGISVVTPNPRTSSGGRWNYVAAYGYALQKYNGDDAAAQVFVKKLYQNTPALDTGARGSTVTFVQRGIGDALVAWENEAILALKESTAGDFELVVPSISVLAEPPVAWVDKVTRRHGTALEARAYLQYLYTEAGQEIIAQNHYRPRNLEILARYGAEFPKIKLFTIDEVFGGWRKAQEKHFGEGGVFERITKP